jgi:hypothetical protein
MAEGAAPFGRAAYAAEAGKAASQVAGVAKVIVADSPSLAENLAENVAAQVLALSGMALTLAVGPSARDVSA